MKIKFQATIMIVSALALSSCVTSTEYSAKGTPVRTVRTPDAGFWTQAAATAAEIFAQKAERVRNEK